MADSIAYHLDRKVLEIRIGDETHTLKNVPYSEYMRVMEMPDPRAFIEEIKGRFEQVMC